MLPHNTSNIRTCSKCQESQPLGEFSARRDERIETICKACYRTKDAEQRKRLREQRDERRRLGIPEPPKRKRKAKAYDASTRVVTPELRIKLRARNRVKAALDRGILTRPIACGDCRRPGPVDAHHEDYGKPLDVEWLCRTCHRDRHADMARALRDQRAATPGSEGR